MASWWEVDPTRRDLELADVHSVAPDLVWTGTGAGQFRGSLPRWPFKRPFPPNLGGLVPNGLEVMVRYGQAFPAAPPMIFAVDPEPDRSLRGFSRFHLLPNGALCLLRDADQWTPRDQTSELLLKASGWLIEYQLLQHGRITALSERGIVEDASFDHLVPEACLP